jgi:metal-responsive CopG/Arc/MetJ family transcriptional regulator
VFLPATLLEKIDAMITANSHLGFRTREEFIEDALIKMLQSFTEKQQQESPKKKSASKKVE